MWDLGVINKEVDQLHSNLNKKETINWLFSCIINILVLTLAHPEILSGYYELIKADLFE